MMNNKSNFGPEGCKLFVGGLSWNTTREMLYEEFSKYGELIDYVVMKNPETGQSRGFGFITFQDQAAAETALNSGGHRVDGRNVDLKHCNPKNNQSKMMNSGGMSYSNSMIMTGMNNTLPGGGTITGNTSKPKNENCKVFVGGLPNGVGEEEIKQFFSRYGPVREFKLHMDELKQKPKGYGFLTFEFEESANQVLQEHYVQLNGKQVEIRPQANNLKQQLNFAQQHHQSQPQQAAASGQFQQYGNVPQHAASNNWNQPQMPPTMNWNSPVVPPAPSGPVPGPASAPMPAAVPWPANTNAPPVGYPNQLWGYPPLNGMPPAPTNMAPQMYPNAPNAPYGYYSGFYDPANYESMDKMAPSGPGYPYDPSMLPGGQVMPDSGLDEANSGMPSSSDGHILQPNMQHYRGSSHGSSSTSSKAPSLSSIQTSSSNMSSSGVSKSSSDLSDVSHQNHHMGRYTGRNSSRGPSGGSRMISERGNGSAGGRRSGGSMANTSMSSESSYSSRSKNGGGGGGAGSSSASSASGNHQFRQSSSYHPYRR